jgi:hypothetical protein
LGKGSGEQSPSLTKITEILHEHESKLHTQIDFSQQAYERFSQEMLALGSDLSDKKQRERFSKL